MSITVDNGETQGGVDEEANLIPSIDRDRDPFFSFPSVTYVPIWYIPESPSCPSPAPFNFNPEASPRPGLLRRAHIQIRSRLGWTARILRLASHGQRHTFGKHGFCQEGRRHTAESNNQSGQPTRCEYVAVRGQDMSVWPTGGALERDSLRPTKAFFVADLIASSSTISASENE